MALSGGRDSALALHLVLAQGMRARAACVDMGEGVPKAAEEVAGHLGVELLSVDGREQFRRQVQQPSRRMLAAGLTPNPCAMCNRGPKLGLLHGMLQPGERLVTGHYAYAGPEGLRRGRDRGKDQSYFLALVPRRVVERCLLPLGSWTKEEVTAESERLGLPFRRGESMDLCFDPAEGLDRPRWTVRSAEGRLLAEDVGPMLPTVGQRLRLSGRPRRLYALSFDFSRRVVVAGERWDLAAEGCLLEGVNLLVPPPGPTFRASVQIRYREAPSPCLVRLERGGETTVLFDDPKMAVAPGQLAALLVEDRVVAGGVIREALKAEGRGS